jgi:hypothetical protein
MSADQSQFSNQPKKILYTITQKLISDDFDEDYSADTYDNNQTILSNISRMFNIDVVHDIDIQFFTKFIKINRRLISEISETKDKSLIDKLVIPIAKTYEMLYNTWGSCAYEEFLKQEVDSYDEEWVRISILRDEADGYWNTYEGSQYSEPQYDNHEENGWNIESVHESNENIQENNFKKTTKVISSMDKKSLLELKSIIDSRLRLL